MTSSLCFLNIPILRYSSEIRSTVLVIRGEKAHSCYFSKDAFADPVKDNPDTDNKELLISPWVRSTPTSMTGRTRFPLTRSSSSSGRICGECRMGEAADGAVRLITRCGTNSRRLTRLAGIGDPAGSQEKLGRGAISVIVFLE